MLSVLMSLTVVRHTHGRLPCTKEGVPRARICVSDLVHVGPRALKSAIALLTYRRATLTPGRKKRPREREQPGPQQRRRLREENGERANNSERVVLLDR